MSLLGPSHDLRLARRAATGDPAAWREIVDRFGPRIHSIAHHFTRDPERAQDLTQEIFLRLFQNLGSFRGDVPLLAWTLRLSRNLCIDDYRRRRLERTFRFLPLETVDGLEDGERPRRRRRSTVSCWRRSRRRSRELDPETVFILTLRDLEGLSYRELEALLDLPSGTVKSRIHRGRRELLRRLELRQAAAGAPRRPAGRAQRLPGGGAVLSGRVYPRAVRRALRAAGLGRCCVCCVATSGPPLPQSLRDRLLAIPAATPHPRAVVAPQMEAADLSPVASWLLTSPLASIAASLVLAVGVSLFLGNPYQAGAATLDEVRTEVGPAANRVRAGVSRLAEVASGAGEAALEVLPRAGMSASRAISRTVQERVGDGEDATTDESFIR